VDKGAGNCHALHLSTGKVVWHTVRKLSQADVGEPFESLGTGIGMSREQKRCLHILDCAQSIQELKRLKNEADFFASQLSQASFIQMICRNAVQADMPGGREIKGASQVQQRRLATSATAHEGNESARSNFERHAIKRTDAFAGIRVLLDHAVKRKQWDGNRGRFRQQGSSPGGDLTLQFDARFVANASWIFCSERIAVPVVMSEMPVLGPGEPEPECRHLVGLIGGNSLYISIVSQLEPVPISESVRVICTLFSLVGSVLYNLISIRISPFSELARWVLDRQGMPYRESCHAPILSLPFTWVAARSLNVPVVLAPDVTLDVQDFINHIDASARADDRILALDPNDRQQAEELIGSILSGLAIQVRQYAYANMLPNRKVTGALMIVRVPWWERALVTTLYPLQAWAMRKALDINPQTTEQSRQQIVSYFENLSKQLKPGQRFLIGDRLTALDLVFAAGTAPVTVPPEYGAPFPTVAEMPPAMQATVSAVQATAAGQLALGIYRDFRKPALMPPQTSPPGGVGLLTNLWQSFDRWLTGPDNLRLVSHLLRLKPVLRIGKKIVISTHAEVVKALLDDEKYTIAQINAARMDRISGPFILGMDRSAEFDRELAAIRSIVKPTDLDWIRRIVNTTAQTLIEAATPTGRLDLASCYARVCGARVVAEYFGVPGPSEHILMQWMRSLFWYVFLKRGKVSAEGHGTDQSSMELRAYLTTLIAQRTAEGATGDDVLSRLIRAGTLDPDGIRRNITGIVVGAIDTTVTAAANAFAVLLDKPDAMSETRKAAESNDEAALRQCVYEAMRFNPQTPALLRYSPADGATALLLTISAMFDPKAFPEPDRFLTNRPLDRYLHFGHGMHTCYGLMINGVQLPAIVGAIVRLPNLRRASGRFRPILYEGPFPDRLAVEFGGSA